VYAGKEREEDILADTMAVPLQPIKTFGTNGGGWTNKMIFGDNLQVMKSLLDDPDVKGQVKLVYIDPLFRLAGAEKVITVEKEAKKQGVSLKVGADYCFSPEDESLLLLIRNLTKDKGVDLAVEASGTPEALDLALKTVAFQGTVLVVSWYGNKPVTCYLGKEFHRRRLNIKCSQVSNLNPALAYRCHF